MTPPASTIARRYQKLGEEVTDMRPVWSRLVPYLQKKIAGAFSSKGSAGTPWPPWRPSYARRRMTGAMMILTGRLRSAATSGSAVRVATRTSLVYGPRVPYARAANARRPFLNISRDVMARFVEETRLNTDKALQRFPVSGGRSSMNAYLARKA